MRCLVIGSTGLIGSAIKDYLETQGHAVVPVHSTTYTDQVGAQFDVVINCNGNSSRYRAAKDPQWDFSASVVSVQQSLFDFIYDRYVFVSTVDVYNRVGDPDLNHEDVRIEPQTLAPYGFHKWLAERAVERYAPQHTILRLGTVVGRGLRKNPIFDLQHEQPIFMSLDSELSLIDVDTIASFVGFAVQNPATQGVFNLSGVGSIRVADVAQRLGVRAALAPGAEDVTYRYRINTAKVAALMRLPHSAEALERYLSAQAA